MDAGKPLRLFVGVRVSLATARALEEEVGRLRAAATGVAPRWVAPAAYHVTLKFLGWTRPEVVEALRDRIAHHLAGARACEVEVRGLGAFPAPGRARVLWAGVASPGAARLAELAERVERATAELGFARDKRAYHPHVTLARLREPGDVSSLVADAAERVYRSSWIDSVILFESTMRSTGSEYTAVARWTLEPGSKGSRRHTRPVEPEAESDSDPGALESKVTSRVASGETPDGDEQG